MRIQNKYLFVFYFILYFIQSLFSSKILILTFYFKKNSTNISTDKKLIEIAKTYKVKMHQFKVDFKFRKQGMERFVINLNKSPFVNWDGKYKCTLNSSYIL